MKSLISLGLLGSILVPQVAFAGHGSRYVGTVEQECYREEYREVYHPGTRSSPGYIDYEREFVAVPCDNHNPYVYDPHAPDYQPTGNVDDNSCIEGSIIGGILGGAIGAGASQGDGRIWAIPVGIAGGALVGCQIDGG